MPSEETKDQSSGEAKPDKPRSANLDAEKSSQCHVEEAKQEKTVNPKNQENLGKEPDEIKSTKEILPEDAATKSDLSGESSG